MGGAHGSRDKKNVLCQWNHWAFHMDGTPAASVTRVGARVGAPIQSIHDKTNASTTEERPNQSKKEWVHAIFNRHVQHPIQARGYLHYTRSIGTVNPVFGGVSMHMPNNKAYKNSLNRFLWNTVREIRTARAFLRWTCTMNICYNGTSKIHFGKYTKIIQQQKAVITTPKAEKMNLVQSHRLEVHRKGFRTHRDYVSVSTSQRKSERKYYKKYINKNI